MNKDILADLNEAQLKAVIHPGGPLLILAGAGSGKTRALTHRAAYLLAQGIAPERILLTTFTNKAAAEMQNRLMNLVQQRLPFAGTFHALCARFLRKHAAVRGYSPDYVIYDADDQLQAIKKVLQQLSLDSKEYNPRAILHVIEEAKHQLIGYQDYRVFARGSFQKTVALVFENYQKLLKQNQAVDFNDLLVEVVKLFQENQNIRERYQEQFEHVLIDEYQDTNKPQYLLSKILAGKHRNLSVVGDAAQAIYSWRGADYKNLLSLQADFPDLTTIRLERNYRSTQNILEAAYGVISNNSLHPILNLWTKATAGEKIKVVPMEDGKAEAEFVAKTLNQDWHEQPQKSLSQNAILYRTNAQSRIFEETFIRAGIPYVLIGGVRFYERQEVKDVLSYLRYASNPKDRLALERITKLGKRRLASVEQLITIMDRRLPPLPLLDKILEVTQYLAKYDEKNPEDLARIENVKELRSVAANFETLADFLENVALVEQDTKVDGVVTPKMAIAIKKGVDAVVLMTIHASKGLEFETVYMVGMEEGLFPHTRSLLSKADLEEERRLCYVGITRARKKVILTYATQRTYFGTYSQNPPSRFLAELPNEVIETQVKSKRQTLISGVDEKLLEKFMNDEIGIDEFLRG